MNLSFVPQFRAYLTLAILASSTAAFATPALPAPPSTVPIKLAMTPALPAPPSTVPIKLAMTPALPAPPSTVPIKLA